MQKYCLLSVVHLIFFRFHSIVLSHAQQLGVLQNNIIFFLSGNNDRTEWQQTIPDLAHHIPIGYLELKDVCRLLHNRIFRSIRALHHQCIANDAEIEAYREYRDREPQDVTDLVVQAAEIEKMKSHINEYRRMLSLQSDVEDLSEEAEELTRKIEKARTLPGEILQECKIPIAGLTVKDGVPLINGLPVSNLSDGEKLDLCIDVAIQNPKGLRIILIDGVEKLSTEWKNRLYDKCREKGLQFIATRTTDDAEMTVYEL